jgi:hypothetical protein
LSRAARPPLPEGKTMAQRQTTPVEDRVDSEQVGRESPGRRPEPIRFDGNPYQASLRTPVPEIARSLQDLLSRRLTAYAVGVQDAKTITRWINGDVDTVRNGEVERRLRTTYQVALMLLTVDAPPTVKAWFLGANPDLDDRSPIEMIREGADREVLGAARSFVANA